MKKVTKMILVIIITPIAFYTIYKTRPGVGQIKNSKLDSLDMGYISDTGAIEKPNPLIIKPSYKGASRRVAVK